MTILNILIFPDNRLSIKSNNVTSITDNIHNLIKNMSDTMFYYNGLGISAPQVNVRQNIILVNISEKFLQPLVLINTKILFSKGFKIYKEGCLSFPNIFINVKRKSIIKLKFTNINGEKRIILIDNLLSICLQHEIDHINGITLYDKMSKIKKNLILKK